MAFDISTQEKLYNEMVAPAIVSEVRSRSKFLDMIKKRWDTIDAKGKYFKQRMNFAGSQAYGAKSNDTYPTAQQGTPGESLVRVKRFEMFSLGFDGLSIELAERGGSPIDPEDFEQQELFKSMADDMSRQLLGDGSGHIAQCNGAGSSTTTLVLDSPYYAKPTMFLKPGRVIDIYKADGTKEVDSIAIASVDSDTQVTLASAQTWSDNSWVYGEDSYVASEAVGKGEIMGLMGIISDADPPKPNDSAGLQGLLVASYPQWKALVFGNSGVKRPFVEDLLLQAMDEAVDYGEISVILYTRALRRIWKAYLDSFRTNTNPDKIQWGGWVGLPFYYDGKNIPMITDKFIPDGTILGLAEDELTIHLVKKSWITWEKVGGSILQKVANKNAFVSEGHIFGNLGVRSRAPFFKITDLDETTV